MVNAQIHGEMGHPALPHSVLLPYTYMDLKAEIQES